jgi:uncharacterized UPF0160 family protein
MSFFTKKKIIVTHNGAFHTDDIFACATISLWLKQRGDRYKIIRTRNPDVIASADYVFDVGGVYDPSHNRFDHHQKEGAGLRENGIPYAAFGLAWKHFGMELCSNNIDVWNVIDQKMASSLDALDNGIDALKPLFENVVPFNASEIFLMYSPTWKEDESGIDDIFISQVVRATQMLSRALKVAVDDREGKKIMIEAYNNSVDKRVVELSISFPRYLLQGTFSALPEPLYVIYPSANHKAWKVEAITKHPGTLESRKLLPEAWRGIMDSDDRIRQITGVPDALFCHRSGFLIFAKSLEGARALAKIALSN